MAAKPQRAERATAPPPVLSFVPLQAGISPRACQVLWGLAWWAWGRKPYCWPTNEQIAALVHCSPRTVVFALKELEAAGFITRHMVKCDRGWYRSIVITDRVPEPVLRMVEHQAEAGDGRATGCATGRAILDVHPSTDLARPPAQDPAFEDRFENQKGERENPAATSPGQAGSPPDPRGTEEPAWLKVDNLTPSQVQHWRAEADRLGPRDPMGRIARQIVERIDRGKSATAPGSPARDHRRPSEESLSEPHDSTKKAVSGQDRLARTEHKTH